MPEPAPTIHDTTDLERQVGDLLEEMQTGTQRLADEVKRAEPGANGSPAAAAPSGAPAAAVDAELTKAAAALAQQPAGASAQTAPAAEPDAAIAKTPEPDLAAAVEKLLDGAAAPPPAATAPEAGGSVKTLDAKLAGLADELIAGEFEDEAAVMKEERPAAPPIVEIAAAPAPAPKAEPVEPAAPASATLLPPPREEPAKPAPRDPVGVAPVVIAAPREAAASLVQRLLATASAPLSDKPHLRDILGWVALVQAFMAMCVWVWVLFVRSDLPVDPPPVTPAKEQAEEGHGAEKSGKSGHEAPKAKTAKKAVKKTSHASSSGGHH